MPTPSTIQHILSELSTTLETGNPSQDELVRKKAHTLASQLTASLQSPRDLAFGACFLVRQESQLHSHPMLIEGASQPAYGACCRAGIQLKLFEAIAGSKGSITASELADQTGSERLLVGR